ncbi:MAG TPA: TolC family protein, partial [Anaeromyxobacteraceae bacterium]|nr:TolC family protein [Anaeromyxobacteraceae bacterium]
MRRASFVLSLALLAPASAPAQAPGAEPDPVLDRLVREALEARPELRQARSLLRAAEERVPQVGRLPDPTLALGIQNDGFQSIQIGKMETSYWQVMLTQPLPWPGKLGLRADAAELEARAAGASLERVRLSVEADVRRAYLDLLLSRDRLKLL